MEKLLEKHQNTGTSWNLDKVHFYWAISYWGCIIVICKASYRGEICDKTVIKYWLRQFYFPAESKVRQALIVLCDLG